MSASTARAAPRSAPTFVPAFQRGGDVHVTVVCNVDVRDLTGIGLPATVTLTGDAWERIDEFRSLP